MNNLEIIKRKVLVFYTRGQLEQECEEKGFRQDWKIENCQRSTLEKYLIKKLSKEV